MAIMKSVKIFLLGCLILLTTGCATNKLQITENPKLPPFLEDISNQDISIARIRQELREGHFNTAERLLNAISKEEVEVHMYKGELYHCQRNG